MKSQHADFVPYIAPFFQAEGTAGSQVGHVRVLWRSVRAPIDQFMLNPVKSCDASVTMSERGLELFG